MESYYDMPSEQMGGLADTSIDTPYLRSLLEKQKFTSTENNTTPLGTLQLGGWNENPIRLTIREKDVHVNLNGNIFPEIASNTLMKGGGNANASKTSKTSTTSNSNSLLEHAKHFHNMQAQPVEQAGGAYLEDSYGISESRSALEDTSATRKMKLFDYVDTIGEY